MLRIKINVSIFSENNRYRIPAGRIQNVGIPSLSSDRAFHLFSLMANTNGRPRLEKAEIPGSNFLKLLFVHFNIHILRIQIVSLVMMRLDRLLGHDKATHIVFIFFSHYFTSSSLSQ